MVSLLLLKEEFLFTCTCTGVCSELNLAFTITLVMETGDNLYLIPYLPLLEVIDVVENKIKKYPILSNL